MNSGTPKPPPSQRLGQKLLILLSAGIVGLVLILPLFSVFYEAFKKGIRFYFETFADPDLRSAIYLSLFIALCTLPLNTLFGIAIAWAMAYFEFRGKRFLEVILDLPFAVSPVIAGMLIVLLFGRESFLGRFLLDRGIPVLFAPPGMVLATIFVTLPFVARELIPLMKSQGSEEEEAATVLGASGFQTFLRVTLPKVRWGLLYGVILLNARALGEFGAVSVVSGHIRGRTNTIPLEIELLGNEYRFTEGFVLATLLTMMGLLTLVAKNLLERKLILTRRGRG